MVDDKNTRFSKHTGNYDEPVIGSEYLVELVENESTHYICLLCKEEGDFETIKYHLATPEHCWTYLVRNKLVSRFKRENLLCTVYI